MAIGESVAAVDVLVPYKHVEWNALVLSVIDVVLMATPTVLATMAIPTVLATMAIMTTTTIIPVAVALMATTTVLATTVASLVHTTTVRVVLKNATNVATRSATSCWPNMPSKSRKSRSSCWRPTFAALVLCNWHICWTNMMDELTW